MVFRSACLVIMALSGPCTAAFADPATPDQAGAVKTALERYLGHGQDGDNLTVVPSGNSYKIDIDVKRTLRVLETLGVTIDPLSYTIMAAPQDDGTWHVTSGALAPFTAKFGEQTTSVVWNGQHFDGIFDPRIPAFTHYTSGYDSISIGTLGKAGTTQTRQLDHGAQTQTATMAADGIIDAHVSQTNSDYAQDIAFDDPKQAKQGIPRKVSIKSGPTTETLVMEGLHARALTDLWAFLVAHPSAAAIKSSQADLRTLLRQALPVFQHWSQEGALEKVTVDSAAGPISAQGLSAHIDLTGLTSDGHVNLGIKVDGLTAPTASLPAWTVDLVPTAFELKNSFSGYRLDLAAQEAVNDFDLMAPQPLTPAMIEKIKTLVGPVDQMVLTIGESHIVSSALDAHFSGEVHFTKPIPTFGITVHATGLDKAIQAIQTKAGGDPSAAQAVAGIMLVKGYGKASSDGSLTWVVAGDATGAVTVNNVQLPFGKGR